MDFSLRIELKEEPSEVFYVGQFHNLNPIMITKGEIIMVSSYGN